MTPNEKTGEIAGWTGAVGGWLLYMEGLVGPAEGGTTLATIGLGGFALGTGFALVMGGIFCMIEPELCGRGLRWAGGEIKQAAGWIGDGLWSLVRREPAGSCP